MVNLKELLDRLYQEYHADYIHTDPVWTVHRFERKEDREIVGFISSSLAYGQVRQIQRAIDSILKSMGNRPYRFIMNFDPVREEGFARFRHRFTTGREVKLLIYLLKRIFDNYGSIEAFYMVGYREEDRDIKPSLISFVERSYAVLGGRLTHGFRFLLPSPAKGSACKRLNLFLRWMVRSDRIDLGVWRGIPPAKLIIPLDTHIARISRALRLTERKTPDWKMAEEVTERLKLLDPEDPLKYDFPLTRLGILKRYEDLLPYADLNL